MKTRKTVLLSAAASAAAAALCALALADTPSAKEKPGHSHESMRGPAKARHETMEQVNDAMKVLGSMAKGQRKFDAATVNTAASTILERLEHAATLFPEGSDEGETKARPEIWSDRAGFEKAMKEAQAAARALQPVKDEAAFRPALGALGQSCKNCHDKYRMSED